MNYNQQLNANSKSSYNIENARIGTFSNRLISITKQPGAKYLPKRYKNKYGYGKTYTYWKKPMQEILLENGDIYITYGETRWCEENLYKTINVTTTESTRIGWKWIHLAHNCDCWRYGGNYSDAYLRKSCFNQISIPSLRGDLS